MKLQFNMGYIFFIKFYTMNMDLDAEKAWEKMVPYYNSEKTRFRAFFPDTAIIYLQSLKRIG